MFKSSLGLGTKLGAGSLGGHGNKGDVNVIALLMFYDYCMQGHDVLFDFRLT